MLLAEDHIVFDPLKQCRSLLWIEGVKGISGAADASVDCDIGICVVETDDNVLRPELLIVETKANESLGLFDPKILNHRLVEMNFVVDDVGDADVVVHRAPPFPAQRERQNRNVVHLSVPGTLHCQGVKSPGLGTRSLRMERGLITGREPRYPRHYSRGKMSVFLMMCELLTIGSTTTT